MSGASPQAPACPKEMTYGPCGGVGHDGLCEVGHFPCAFLGREVVRWPGPPAVVEVLDPLLEAARTRPLVVCDLPERPLDATSIRRNAAALAPVADATLFGDAGWARVRFPPSYRAALVAAEGLRPWAGVNCRDRNRVALEGEVAALVDVGAAVHCVTGDHPLTGHRPDAKPVFDIDSVQLAALARRAGALVSVGENPAAPPMDARPLRLVEKVRAGAQVCVINHAGTPDRVRHFVADAAEAGAGGVSYLVCLPLAYSAGSLALLRTFTGLALPPGMDEAVSSARHPLAAGVDVAVRFAEHCLDVPGVVGVVLGAPHPEGEDHLALTAIATVSRALRGRP